MKRMRAHSGITLIEMLMYIAVFVVLLDLAFSAFYRTQRNALNLRRNADDIVRAVHAGERWRADVRAATAEPQLLDDGLHIPTRAGEIVYSFSEGVVWRRAGNNPSLVLKSVKASTMQVSIRQRINAWCWEVELATPQKVTRVQPLFTFVAVAGGRP